MNEITAAIKKKAEEKYPYWNHFSEKDEVIMEVQRTAYASGQVDAIESVLRFSEWASERSYRYNRPHNCWTCNAVDTPITTEQLLLKYMEETK